MYKPERISKAESDNPRISQLERECIAMLVPKIPHRPCRDAKVENAISYTIKLYQQVLAPQEYENLLVFLRSARRPRSTFFVDPALPRDIQKNLPLIKTEMFGIPVFQSNRDRGKIASDRHGTMISRLITKGYMVFGQSPASMLPYALACHHLKERRFSPGSQLRIVDLCGAPGNKTLNFLHFPEVREVTALLVDKNEKRLARTRERLTEFQFGHKTDGMYSRVLPDGRVATVVLAQMDASNPDELEQMMKRVFGGEKAHVVIADVPCPSDGMIARNASVATRRQPRTIGDCPLQRSILLNALSLVEPGKNGLVSYSTCSVNPVINVGVVNTVYAEHPYLDILEVPDIPPFVYGESTNSGPARGIFTSPHKSLDTGIPMGDGFYCCQMQT